MLGGASPTKETSHSGRGRAGKGAQGRPHGLAHSWQKAETLPAPSHCPAPITGLTAVSSLPSSVLNEDKGLGQHL